eukprot:5503945-Amphidinium_carterae.1
MLRASKLHGCHRFEKQDALRNTHTHTPAGLISSTRCHGGHPLAGHVPRVSQGVWRDSLRVGESCTAFNVVKAPLWNFFNAIGFQLDIAPGVRHPSPHT